jgi:shikimate kinase
LPSVPEATLSARIALIGLPGAGKSVVAPLLAARLGFAHLDLDLGIERDEGVSIAELIRGRGEGAFRELETRALARALEEGASQGLVVACGGGILEREENRERLGRAAHVIWLVVTPETAAGRMGGAGRDARPLLDGGGVVERLRSLHEARRAAYRRAAHATVDTEGRSATEVADLAAATWRERAAWDSSAS